MVKGYRWIKTAPDVWQFEGPPKSRRFHGMVFERDDDTASFCLPGGYTVSAITDGNRWYGEAKEFGAGERGSVRAAKDEVEKQVGQKSAAA